MSWWTTRGKFKEDPDNIIYCLLKKIHQQIAQPLTHVLDRGYASEKMLRYLFRFEQDFIIRWFLIWLQAMIWSSLFALIKR